MGNFKNVKKGTKIGLFVFLALSVAMFVSKIINLFARDGFPYAVWYDSAALILIAALMLYVFVLYKKPHGNLLRYLFFGFGVYMAAMGVLDFMRDLFVPACFRLAATLIITYVSGRLNKIEKNKPLLLVAGVFLLIYWCLYNFVYSAGQISVRPLLGSLSTIIYLGAFSFAYVARYEEHKAAGLEDK